MSTPTTTAARDEQIAPAPAADAPPPAALPGPATLLATAGTAAGIVGLSGTTLDVAPANGSSDAVRAAEAAITDELGRGGPAFGTFIRAVGLAVADTQAALDKILVQTAKELAEAKVDTVALFAQELNDDGQMENATPVIQTLPLISFVHPTAYQFTQVHLSADMEVSEFNTANGLNIKKSSTDVDVKANASYGFGGLSAGGSVDVGVKSSDESERKSGSERKSAGRLHMEATLEPRPDFALPQPFIVQKGPKLRVVIGERRQFDASNTPTDDPKAAVKREVDLLATLTPKQGGTASGKPLDVLCDASAVSLTISNQGKTDGNGNLTITLVRSGLTAETSAPVTANVRVGMNLVSASVPVSI
jgi:hypothetical protein